MVVGYNHNFRYRGIVYHIQTEDGGVKNPNIVTLLYRGGSILASKKTSYLEMVNADNLGKVVETLMKDQHREMLRALKSGEFDPVIAQCQSDHVGSGSGRGLVPAVIEPNSIAPEKSTRPEPAEQANAFRAQSDHAGVATSEQNAEKSTEERNPSEASLEDIILSYLTGED